VKNPDLINISSNPAFEQYLDSRPKKDLIKLIMLNSDIKIPISIFLSDMAPLEAVVKYLKDTDMSLVTIAKRLNRSTKTIWTTYNNVKNKILKQTSSQYAIPLSLLFKDNLSIMESVVYHLHNYDQLTIHQIAVMLKRDDRTIWTMLYRANQKNEVKR
jgi:DNA-binding CsgD family transcriptional regulator